MILGFVIVGIAAIFAASCAGSWIATKIVAATRGPAAVGFRHTNEDD